VSRRQSQRPVILGPDGKPYVAPPKKPEPKADAPKSDGGNVVPSSFVAISDESHVWSSSLLRSLMAGGGSLTISTGCHKQPGDFRAVTAEQFDALTEGFDGHGGEELPTPPRDLTTYRDAYASATANCKHIDAVEVLYQRQWSCDDCGRILNRDDMRRAGYGRGYFS